MTTIKRKLIIEAKKKSGKIYPVVGRKYLKDCFTIEHNGKTYFWYNDESNSTCITHN